MAHPRAAQGAAPASAMTCGVEQRLQAAPMTHQLPPSLAHVSTGEAAGSTSMRQSPAGTPALQGRLPPIQPRLRGGAPRRGRRAAHHGDVEVAPEDAVRAQRGLLRGLHGGAAVERHERERVQLRHVHRAARRQAVPRRHHQRQLVLRGRAADGVGAPLTAFPAKSHSIASASSSCLAARAAGALRAGIPAGCADAQRAKSGHPGCWCPRALRGRATGGAGRPTRSMS